MLHIVSMTLTRRRRWWWCCIGVKCSSTVLPAGNYTMYVGLGCLSTTTVCVCVCVRERESIYLYLYKHKAQLVWYMKHD